ncbi:hypothetical protein EVAR_23852_1 [Eumeta japonica]|uniref:Uncharacterized protein n=1 Tax=Eumeta variegata TaxID=151549 RepID=A0A4C1V4D4_EUMVA|nr:hypothetical protein EVAR_23852_1 [Eumeta japonica]
MSSKKTHGKRHEEATRRTPRDTRIRSMPAHSRHCTPDHYEMWKHGKWRQKPAAPWATAPGASGLQKDA